MATRIRMPEPFRLRVRGRFPWLAWIVALVAIALLLALAWQAFGPARSAAAKDSERQAFVERLQKDLDHLSAALQQLQERLQQHTEKLSDQARKELEAQKPTLERLRDEAQRLLDDAQKRSDEAWHQAQPHLEQSWKEFRDGLQKLFGNNSK
jgi:uncharacterized protein YlxW (UPF0749 family)